jgi:hypothetical protein
MIFRQPALFLEWSRYFDAREEYVMGLPVVPFASAARTCAAISELSANGAFVASYHVPQPTALAFDGVNLWVASQTGAGSVTKVDGSSGAVLGSYARRQKPAGVR